MGNLLDALDGATEEDLKTLDREIDAQSRRLESLRACRKVLQLKLVGRPERKKRQPTEPGQNGGGTTKNNRQKMAEYLIHSGPTKPLVLADACGLDHRGVSGLLNHPWFERKGDGVTLSQEGRKAFG
jgi:hypothetical protein